MAYLTLLVALSISGVAAWYSIVGLTAIFAAAKIPIIIMGSVLEVGKLVTASWLYNNWRQTPVLLKSYLTVAVVVLMFITSMGIFGFLSKAHIDQVITTGGGNELQISTLQRKIDVRQSTINDAQNALSILDSDIKTLQDYDRIRGPQGAIAVRQSQQQERDQLNQSIDTAQDEMDALYEQLLPLKSEQIKLEAEVGPIKYIAEMVYDDTNTQILEKAVRGVILTIIFVFDPLAVLLVIAANMSIKQRRNTVVPKKVAVVQSEEEFVVEDRYFDVENWFEPEPTVAPEPKDETPETPPVGIDLKINPNKNLQDQLADVDKELKVLYNAGSIYDKERKRALERLRAKLVQRINNERG